MCPARLFFAPGQSGRLPTFPRRVLYADRQRKGGGRQGSTGRWPSNPRNLHGICCQMSFLPQAEQVVVSSERGGGSPPPPLFPSQIPRERQQGPQQGPACTHTTGIGHHRNRLRQAVLAKREGVSGQPLMHTAVTALTPGRPGRDNKTQTHQTQADQTYARSRLDRGSQQQHVCGLHTVKALTHGADRGTGLGGCKQAGDGAPLVCSCRESN